MNKCTNEYTNEYTLINENSFRILFIQFFHLVCLHKRYKLILWSKMTILFSAIFIIV